MTAKFSFASRFLLVLLAFAASGCASAPVQEMSDARQAIRAAQDAGAANYAPDSLNKARTLLSEAENALQKREFRYARHKATAAHAKAAEALRAAEVHNGA